jgi:hypothetical protein
MEINKKFLLIRIITFPFKLLFTLLWMIFFGLLLSFRWLLYGSQEVYFGKHFGNGELIKIINQNEKIIKLWKEK